MGRSLSNRSSQLRVFGIVLVLGCFALGATVTGAVLYVRHVAETTLLNVAKAAGIRLTLGEINWGFGFVQLFDTRFDLIGIRGATGTVRRIDIDLDGLMPSRILLSKVSLSAKGDPKTLYDELTAYETRLERLRFSQEAKSPSPKLEVREVSVEVESTHPFIPSVKVSNLRILRNQGKLKDETAVSTSTTRIGTLDLGALTLVFREPAEGGIQLGYGTSLAQSQWVFGYRNTETGPTLVFALDPTDASLLFARFGQLTPEAFTSAKIGGKVSYVIDSSSGKGYGQLEVELTGFVPPHPAELRGYSFHDKTTLEATIEGEPLLTTFALPVLKLTNGDFRFLGNGKVERDGFGASVIADLNTSLDCATLAKGYAKSELGGSLGAWAEQGAKRVVRGQVNVRLQLDARTDAIAEAKVVKRIGLGCGLRPLTVQDLLSLGLPPSPEPETVERLTQKLKQNVTLPSVPSLFPSFAEVLGSPFGNATKTGKASSAVKP